MIALNPEQSISSSTLQATPEGLYLFVSPQDQVTVRVTLESAALKRLAKKEKSLTWKTIEKKRLPKELRSIDERVQPYFAEGAPFYHLSSPPEIFEAGLSLLDLTLSGLKEGLEIPDPSPDLFVSLYGRTLFANPTAFRRRGAGDPTWEGYLPFICRFYIPLLLHKLNRASLERLKDKYPTGITPKEAYKELSFLKRLHPLAFPAVTVPSWLGMKYSRESYKKSFNTTSKRADKLVAGLVTHLRYKFLGLRPKSR